MQSHQGDDNEDNNGREGHQRLSPSSSPTTRGDPEYASVPAHDEEADGIMMEQQRRRRAPSSLDGFCIGTITDPRLYLGILLSVVVILGLLYRTKNPSALNKNSDAMVVTIPQSEAVDSSSSVLCFDSSSGSGNLVPIDTHTIHYNPKRVNNNLDNVKGGGGGGDIWDTDDNGLLPPPTPPVIPASSSNSNSNSNNKRTTKRLGYLRQPSIHNNTLVFVTEGDLYYARTTTTSTKKVAMKLTTTVGNVDSPRIHPTNQGWIAFTATYTKSRDVYLLNLNQQGLVQRLTFGLDSANGVTHVLGWKDDSHLLVTAYSTTMRHLPGPVVYELDVDLGDNNNNNPPSVVNYRPLPLAQAVEGVYHRHECFYFVRARQSSNTARYRGGTVEQIWRYCDQDPEATLVTPLQGTSKSPSVATYEGVDYLLYLSDRNPGNKGPHDDDDDLTTMNLWALPLTSADETTPPPDDDSEAVPLTRISCQFQGMALREYAVDTVTRNVVLRIGGDFYQLSSADVIAAISSSKTFAKPKSLGVQVYSDFRDLQERLIPISDSSTLAMQADVVTLTSGTSTLLTLRGQVWMAPVVDSSKDVPPYSGSGQNLPRRRYRIVPSSQMGGSVRVLVALQVPLLMSNPDDPRRLALVLSTDPLSPTAEHAFYLVEVHESATVIDLERPVLGGHRSGGSTAQGGLGSVLSDSVTVSPCGRRVAWADTDGRICVWTLPIYSNQTNDYQVLPSQNEMEEPMDGTTATLSWSSGGRYLAVSHAARNQFEVISIVDCGDPTPLNHTATELEIPDIQLGRRVQVTSSRFNSNSMYWGKSTMDYYVEKKALALGIAKLPAATTLYFLTDRDVTTDVQSPWGTRAPAPHFDRMTLVYALPLTSKTTGDWDVGRFAGGGAQELFGQQSKSLDDQLSKLKETAANTLLLSSTGPQQRNLRQVVDEVKDDIRSRRLTGREAASVVRWLQEVVAEAADADGDALKAEAITATKNETINPGFPTDMAIDFGPTSEAIGRRAYRIAMYPKGKYIKILAQALDDPTLVIVEYDDVLHSLALKVWLSEDFPSDKIVGTPVTFPGLLLVGFGQSTSREHFLLNFAPGNKVRVVGNTVASIASFILDSQGEFSSSFADTSLLALSVVPRLEYQQMYDDAWRLLRDYFWDPSMHGVDWPAVHARYRPLVERCTKREELDDVLEQMAAELSALHVFVYGGEYDTPFGNNPVLGMVHEPASLGVTLERAPEWKGYRITEIPQRDPDFNLVDSVAVYCPLSDSTLRLSGQKGLQVGDVIVAVNGESAMQSDIYALLRGMSDRTVRLEVLRLASGDNATLVNATMFVGGAKNETTLAATTESVIATAISREKALNLRYHAWEYATRLKAKELAKQAGFSVAYIHLRSMIAEDVNAFARQFYPDYDKQALILDVRHNGGGDIDSWIITALQRKPFMYWKGRTGARHGSIDWDEQFAFRGHVVVLVDEHTSSDGEGVARGISELGLGRLIGTRTWGGGIWLSSDNVLVDGGIATAPEIGTFNTKLGYGMGIEGVGIVPDIVVDNNPRTVFEGKDTQLERAIEELKKWLQDEPVLIPAPPDNAKDLSLHEDDCPA